ncbi:hypothetical protein PEBR_39501 [Penicillium brasilianum]|uniref:Uncharacterized protein n=1 Tax=Penicillium brasilianum TaxID=104259 RepID=A0A1S9R9Y5_PENBI|nr:hypothetical protein PEBR_39501 [Penicillium brasilianum]
MSVSAKNQAKAQGQEDRRNTDKDEDLGASKPWSGIQPRFMNVDQEKHSSFNPEEVGKPEPIKGNRLIHSKPEGANQYSQGHVEG